MTSTIAKQSRSAGKAREWKAAHKRGRVYRCFALLTTPTYVKWHVLTYMDAARLFVRALWYLLFAMLTRLAKLFLEDTIYLYDVSGNFETTGIGLIEYVLY